MTPGVGQEERIIQTMRQLGFTANEGKAYIALLKKHPATGYEVSARSGIPRSAVYNVLRRLENLGLVNSVQAKPARYVPLEPERLSDLLAVRFSSTMDDLKSAMKNLAGRMAPATTWTVQGYAAMIERARQVIEGARRSVYASIWGREAKQLEEPLKQALANGVEILLFSFTPLPEGVGRCYSYGITEEELGSYWSHKIILIGDHKEALIGGAELKPENRAVVTNESSLIEMAIANLVLDVTLFGERTGAEVHEMVTSLSLHMAPIDQLIEKSSG